MNDLDRLFILKDGGKMATLDITYTIGGTFTATSGEFSQHEPIKVNLELKGTTDPCSVSMVFADWSFHLVPKGDHTYELDLSRALRKATKGLRIATATAYSYKIKVVKEDGTTYQTSTSKTVTVCASNLGTYGEDELDRAFREVSR